MFQEGETCQKQVRVHEKAMCGILILELEISSGDDGLAQAADHGRYIINAVVTT